ncbi:Exocyst complex component 1 [Branchiostoma belcheri]|nr:Exocyst complex component 1 [Branchiostoma belcheri]
MWSTLTPVAPLHCAVAKTGQTTSCLANISAQFSSSSMTGWEKLPSTYRQNPLFSLDSCCVGYTTNSSASSDIPDTTATDVDDEELPCDEEAPSASLPPRKRQNKTKLRRECASILRERVSEKHPFTKRVGHRAEVMKANFRVSLNLETGKDVSVPNFDKCSVCKATCVERTRVKRKLKGKRSREEEDGPQSFRKERQVYWGKVYSAHEDPTSKLSITLDGMDQSKTAIPHFMQKTNESEKWKLKTHLTGVLVHGLRLAYAFIDNLRWPHDSNLTCTVLLATLRMVAVESAQPAGDEAVQSRSMVTDARHATRTSWRWD